MTAPTRPGDASEPPTGGGPTLAAGFEIEAPDVSQIVIDDGAPVDNVLSEKQMRLLTEPLYGSWLGPPEQEEGERRPFLAAANVGLFSTPHDPPLVPDLFSSLDVETHPDLWKEKKHRTYFFWEFGKPADVAIEIVSNREGEELTGKKRGYAHAHPLLRRLGSARDARCARAPLLRAARRSLRATTWRLVPVRGAGALGVARAVRAHRGRMGPLAP